MAKKRELAAYGGKPVWSKPWSTGPFHFPSDIDAVRDVLSGPALPMGPGQTRDGLPSSLHIDHFWFSWAAFRPETRIYEVRGRTPNDRRET